MLKLGLEDAFNKGFPKNAFSVKEHVKAVFISPVQLVIILQMDIAAITGCRAGPFRGYNNPIKRIIKIGNIVNWNCKVFDN